MKAKGWRSAKPDLQGPLPYNNCDHGLMPGSCSAIKLSSLSCHRVCHQLMVMRRGAARETVIDLLAEGLRHQSPNVGYVLCQGVQQVSQLCCRVCRSSLVSPPTTQPALRSAPTPGKVFLSGQMLNERHRMPRRPFDLITQSHAAITQPSRSARARRHVLPPQQSALNCSPSFQLIRNGSQLHRMPRRFSSRSLTQPSRSARSVEFA